MYMIDYLNAIFPEWGVFADEEDAWDWIKEFQPEEIRRGFTVFEIGVNPGNVAHVHTDAPRTRYTCQR